MEAMTEQPKMSPDGNYWWDGAAWQLFQRAQPRKGNSGALILVAVLVAVIVSLIVGFAWGSSSAISACNSRVANAGITSGGSAYICGGY